MQKNTLAMKTQCRQNTIYGISYKMMTATPTIISSV